MTTTPTPTTTPPTVAHDSVTCSVRVVLSHKQRGVYLGSCLGFGFWSKWDAAGQDAAWTFESVAQAKEAIASWDSPVPENELMFTHIEVESEFATMEQCVAAGLEPWEVDRASVTVDTVEHDSSTCRLGPNGMRCFMCQMAEDAETSRVFALDKLGQSTAAIRARRAALLERADIHSPTEGAVALAEAWLDATDWYRRLPNNAMQDAAVLELAGEIEGVIGGWLQRRQEDDQ